MTPFYQFIYRHAKKVIVLVFGVTIILLGLLTIPFPGPGPAPILIFFGLGVLATEFLWARSLMRRSKQFMAYGADHIENLVNGKPKPGEHRKPGWIKRMVMKIKVPGDPVEETPTLPTPPPLPPDSHQP